jgi:hypothetical protein
MVEERNLTVQIALLRQAMGNLPEAWTQSAPCRGWATG